ncbi:MAG: potassium-transporting ATPase subunit KdpA [Actinobacteria bacterium RBG_16_70_17]|nr:MAG: potassium-transporting ATPase subunit KdpA [Actinobacteria bacterium RBG_16_70_17]
MAGWLQLSVLVLLLAAAYRPLGDYMAWALTSPRHLRVERWCYRLCRIDPQAEQTWRGYATSLLAFSVAGVLLLYLMLRLQGHLPLSQGHGAVSPALAFHTAVSFATNTNWQNYSGEQTLGYGVQMAGLTVQNFVSAAVGIAVAVALVRGLIRAGSKTVGNFWVDLVRACVRILLPLAFVFALVLVSQGVVQDLRGAEEVATLSGGTQEIPGGPIASQEAIKELGTNGGGFFNANSAHPFENPTPVSNLVEVFLLLVIPFSLTGTFGKMAGDRRQGYVVAAVMLMLWVASALLLWHFESGGNPAFPDQVAGGNMVGKEVRFGVAGTSLFAASTTGTSTGAVNGSMDSLTAFGGAIPLANMMLSEVSPGGVGSGLYGMLVLAILSVFIAGLMVGRTPEYLGKSIAPREMKLVTIFILVVPMVVLVLAAVALAVPSPRASILNPGPHGLTEVLYAFTSQANNNGSAFAGLNGNTAFYNIAGGAAMLVGRFGTIIPVLALAGSLAAKRRVPPTPGTFPTTAPLFAGLLAGVVLIVTALIYFPALSLGPIVEGLPWR